MIEGDDPIDLAFDAVEGARVRRAMLALAIAGATLIAFTPRAEARHWGGRNIGIGLVLGQPTGLTLDIRPNYWSSFEIDVGLGTFNEGDSGYAHLTYQVRILHLTQQS